MYCANSHLLIKYFFLYLLVLYVNFSVKPLNFAPKWSIFYFKLILVAIFVTIATVKVKEREDYTLVIVLIGGWMPHNPHSSL